MPLLSESGIRRPVRRWRVHYQRVAGPKSMKSFREPLNASVFTFQVIQSGGQAMVEDRWR